MNHVTFRVLPARFLPRGFCTAVVLFSLQAASAWAVSLHLSVNVYGHNQQQEIYAAILPNGLMPTDIPFQTGMIETADHRLRTTYQGDLSWFGMSSALSNHADLLSALSQPVLIVLDEGLATERRYSSSLQVGSLATTAVTAPIISAPTNNALLNSSHPTLEFSLPGNLGNFSGRVGHFEPSNSVDDFLFSAAPGMTEWTVPAGLSAGTLYYFSLHRTFVPTGTSFSVPVDGVGNALPGWQARSQVIVGHAESIVQFTVVPEPGTAALLGIGGAAFIVRRRRRERLLTTASAEADR